MGETRWERLIVHPGRQKPLSPDSTRAGACRGTSCHSRAPYMVLLGCRKAISYLCFSQFGFG